MSINRIFSWTFLALAGGLFIFFSSIIALFADWWWFQEVGFTEIFIKSLTIKVVVGGAVGLAAAVFLLTNFLIAAHSKIPWMTSIPASVLGQPVTLNDRLVKRLGIFANLLVALFIGLIASASWQDILKFLMATPFNTNDPLFGKDVAFYVFSLPIYLLALGLAKALIIFSLINVALVYILRGSFSLASIIGKFGMDSLQKNGGFHFRSAKPENPASRIHIGILLFLFLASTAASTYLSLFNLLTGQNGPVFGASFTDATIMVPLLHVSAAVYGLAALLALYYGLSGRIAPLFGALGLTVLVGFATGIIPSVFQKLIVAPNELVKETPFIKHNIKATREAYNLDQVEKRNIAADQSLTAEDITENNLTIKNVRLWDRDPLLSTFSQIQEIRTYYEFASVDNDRYTINGELRQIMLSPRELASESLPNKNWINEHLTFTHGYGIAAGPVNQVTPEGLPVLFVKDLPPKSELKELAVNRPEIYYGELVNDWVVVKSQSKEFNYPKGEENVYATYEGQGGVEINSPLKRLVYSLHFSTLKLFLSGDITPQSRIMYYRNAKERVAKIAPFLSYDHDPYLVVADGKLYWIIDAYTSTNLYPYSERMAVNDQNVNYIRNSVKAVVDAYDGTVTLYQSDPDDPIIKTYTKIFPNTFKPVSEMPESLASHLRYPEDIFTAQTAIYSTYHMDDPQIFYNKEDQWEVPSISSVAQTATQTDSATPVMTPRHMIMKLPDEEKEEFILMLPYTPRAKDNLSAWIVARNDGDNYGKLVVYRFPKDKLIFGPKQIIGRINQDADVSRQIALWDQRGSQVIQGPLLVIPIEKSLVYVRPLYLKAESGKIPELKRVIVAYENKIAMEETLEKGLARIFGASDGSKPPAGATPTPTPAGGVKPEAATETELYRDAQSAYDAAIEAQRNGDWARYGEEIKKLGDILQKLQ